jgi:hypothetical protein
MTGRNDTSPIKCDRRPGVCLLCRILFLYMLLSVFMNGPVHAQEQAEFDEFLIFLDIQRIGSTEIPAVIYQDQAYLPVTDIFSFLKIRVVWSQDFDTISGFFISQEAPYSIERLSNRIVYQGKVHQLNPGDLIRTESNLYLKSNYFGEIFGLDCRFSFRSLSVTLVTQLELPLIREMRQEMMRNNISKLKGEIKADTVISRKYPAFHFGMADWSVISTQELEGITDTRLNLGLGAIIAGGEANISLNYSTNEPFIEKNQQYLWRFVNNDFKPLRQSSLGKINTQATSTIYSPVVGAQFTNTPTTFRRAFGTYTLSDRTEPGWIVELYVNNVLVDYVKADASGFFTFEVPLVYGNTEVRLRYYGPWGEERSREENISIPFNFIPHRELEYTVSGGMVEDGKQSAFARGNVNYGLAKSLTVGGGVEYLSSVTSGEVMPFANLSARLLPNLLISGEYTYGVRAKGVLNYRLPSNLFFELYYTWYEEDQTAINFNYEEERKFIVSLPIRTRHMMLYSRLTVDQIVLPTSSYTTSELLFSGSIYGVNTNFSTYALFTDPAYPYVYSRLSLGFHLPARFIFTPQAQFDYNDARFVSMKFELEKHLFSHGYANVSYEQNFRSDYQGFQIGFRYDLPFAQTAVTARTSNISTTFIESARGSLMLDAGTGYAGASDRINVGKGGVVIIPFLDINCNGQHDEGEPRVAGLNIRTSGGRVRYNMKDTTIRIFDMEAYTHYFIEFDRFSFDNIGWQLAINNLSVVIDPNSFKKIEVPVSVFGEVTGTVYLQNKGRLKGQGRVIVNIHSSDSVLVARTLTENDGYFSYLGLPPGAYYAVIDTSQLSKLKLKPNPGMIPFEINQSFDGDYIEEINFVLDILETKETEETKPSERNPEDKGEFPEPAPGKVMVQIGAFRNIENANHARSSIGEKPGLFTVIKEENGFYKVVVTGFTSNEEASVFLEYLSEQGFKGAFIIKDQ